MDDVAYRDTDMSTNKSKSSDESKDEFGEIVEGKKKLVESRQEKGDYEKVQTDQKNQDINDDDDENTQDPYPETEKEENENCREETETEIALINDSVKIDIKSDEEGEDTATLPLKKKKSEEIIHVAHKKKPSMMLFPITRLRLAWTKSSNTCEFMLRAIVIVFSTFGWIFCVGGIPFLSLAELIIGSVYKDDCKIQPNIPMYLIVTGVFGTVQHLIAVWTKYLPKESQGRLRVYRAYCVTIDLIIQLFLAIWFVVGCIWVYNVHQDVDYEDPNKNEYCHKTLYLFAFWILNLSFIVLAFLVVSSLCCILCIVTSPKTEEVEH